VSKRIWKATDKYSILNFEEEGATLTEQGREGGREGGKRKGGREGGQACPSCPQPLHIFPSLPPSLGIFHGLTTWVRAATNATARRELADWFKITDKQVREGGREGGREEPRGFQSSARTIRFLLSLHPLSLPPSSPPSLPPSLLQVNVVASHLAASVNNEALFAELKARYLTSLPEDKASKMEKEIQVSNAGGREGGRQGGRDLK